METWVVPVLTVTHRVQTVKVVAYLILFVCKDAYRMSSSKWNYWVNDAICNFDGFCWFTLPSVMCEGACFPTALPTECITKLWDFCHIGWWEM